MSPCEAHVLWFFIFLEEDQEIEKIRLYYALNYAPGEATDGNSMISTSATQLICCKNFPYAYMSLCKAHVLWLGSFLEEDQETEKIPLYHALN